MADLNEMAACTCDGKCPMTEDRHWVNCPQHLYHKQFLALTRPTPTPADQGDLVERVAKAIANEMLSSNASQMPHIRCRNAARAALATLPDHAAEVRELRERDKTQCDFIERTLNDSAAKDAVIAGVMDAMNALLRSPKGVVPEIAQPFYDAQIGAFTEARTKLAARGLCITRAS